MLSRATSGFGLTAPISGHEGTWGYTSSEVNTLGLLEPRLRATPGDHSTSV